MALHTTSPRCPGRRWSANYSSRYDVVLVQDLLSTMLPWPPHPLCKVGGWERMGVGRFSLPSFLLFYHFLFCSIRPLHCIRNCMIDIQHVYIRVTKSEYENYTT